VKQTSQISEEALEKARTEIQAIIENIETVIVGKHASVELVVLALLARGHVLIEDVPGVGKTSLVSAVAKSVDCAFQRIQFTPDLMPSDVTGFSVYNQGTGEFEFRPGARPDAGAGLCDPGRRQISGPQHPGPPAEPEQ
jgi:MoxR-like ATPase